MGGFDEKDYNRSFDIKVWKRLLPLLKNYRWAFFWMILFNLLTAAIDVVIPLFQRYAITNFIEPSTPKGLLPFILAYIIVIIGQSLSVIGFGRNSMKIEMNFGRDMRQKLFVHLQTLSFSYFKRHVVHRIIRTKSFYEIFYLDHFVGCAHSGILSIFIPPFWRTVL
jgi:ATP-binding cassette subfamily B protein